MRPIHLKLQAFGPFADSENIDFTRLGLNPLFLINGPTGAGKSSILDAICFALYGQTTGAERDPAQMRCDHADPSVLTEVVLNFKLGETGYRIRRIPTQERPKSRGEGTTTQQAEAQLWQLDDSDQGALIVAKSVSDATDEIRKRIGLDVEQFRQVMVLPQGKFRDLLMADSKEREKIFGQLFQTQIYKRIEVQLYDQAKVIKQEVEQQRNQIKGILQSVDLNVEAEIDEELEQLTSELSAALLNKDRAYEQQVLAANTKENAQSLKQRFDNLSSKQEELAKKTAIEPDITVKQTKLNHALNAQKIHPVYKAHQEKAAALFKLHVQIADSAKALESATEQKNSAERLLQEAQTAFVEVESLNKKQLELSQYQERVKELLTAQDSQIIFEKTLETSQSNLDKQIKENDALSTEMKKNEVSLEQIAQQLEALAPKQIELETYRDKYEQRKNLEAKRIQHSQSEQQEKQLLTTFKSKKSLFETAQTQTRQLEFFWHSSQAALLAKELKIDEPCPVCGSKEHPSPAHLASDTEPVSKQEVDNARTQEDKARKAMETAKSVSDTAHLETVGIAKDVNQLIEQLAQLAEQTVSEVEQAFNNLQTSVHKLLEQQAKQKELIKKNADINGQLTDMAEIISTLEVRVQLDNEQVLTARANVEQLEKWVPEPYRNAQVLSEAIADLTTRIKKLTDAVSTAQSNYTQKSNNFASATATRDELVKQQNALQIECKQAASVWNDALAQSAFEHIELFQQALMSDQEEKDLKYKIETYKSELAELKGGVTQLQADLAGQTMPDLEKLALELNEKIIAFKDFDSAYSKLQERHNQLKSVKIKLTKAHEKNAELDAQYRIYGTLSDVANGQTGNKISLQRFVLSVLLDDVLIQASQRLNIMSNGRYQLVRKEDRTKGNKASGLDLEVEDGYTGKNRPVATLSGGESFMAALSLALGLSDVVQSYAGGIKLDTLFIDEGFGSLDPESLDLAIKTLIDLQASGRMIGIISHVSELKEQMALRLDVMSSRNGSSIRTIS